MFLITLRAKPDAALQETAKMRELKYKEECDCRRKISIPLENSLVSLIVLFKSKEEEDLHSGNTENEIAADGSNRQPPLGPAQVTKFTKIYLSGRIGGLGKIIWDKGSEILWPLYCYACEI